LANEIDREGSGDFVLRSELVRVGIGDLQLDGQIVGK
jgi:hypothetical protein